ncbi:MAG: tetratricopeptide repeat protein, partial [Planctomycetota bacterium]|nr:tetratricopeptide repeat protein [Planctomycetota bacterium]
LTELKKSSSKDDYIIQKIQAYLLLKNQKYSEADGLCTKLLTQGLDHELLCWRGIALAELGLWFAALGDLRLSQDLFPVDSTEKRIEHTTRRACETISEGMQLEGSNFQDFFERAKIYTLKHDFSRAERDLNSAERLKPASLEIRKTKAEIAYASGKLKEALVEINDYLEYQPEDLDAIILKAKIKSDRGRLRTALALLRNATTANRSSELSHLKIAYCRVALRDFHGAIGDFNTVAEINPNACGAFSGRGLAHLEIRNFDAAIDDFEKAIEIGGKNAIYYSQLGEAKLGKASTKEASSHFKMAMKIEPRCWQARLGYARVKNERAKQDDALQIANQLLKRHDHLLDIQQFIGSVHFEKQEFDLAIESFTAAIENCRSNHETGSCYYQRGTAKLENNQILEAAKDFDQSLKLRPFHVGTLAWRGYTNGKLGKWSEAINDLQSAIDMNPMAAEQYKKLGDFIAKHAIQYFETRIDNNPADTNALFSRGMAYLFLNENTKAHLDFEQTLSLDPKHGEAQVRLGTLYLKEDQPKKAYTLLSSAMKTKPSSQALILRAEARLQLGVIQPALLDIRDAIRTSQNNDRLYVRRGELYVAKENWEKALQDFTLSIALNPDNFQAFRNRARLYVQRGAIVEAINDFTMSLHFYPKQPELFAERGKLHLQLEQHEKAASDFETAIGYGPCLQSYVGRALAMSQLDRGQEALIWLTKAIHRFPSKQEWAQLVKTRAEIFLSLGRFERASADARIASKLNPEAEFSADCYYIRALCSYHHNDTEHAIKTLEKANKLDENHKGAELALDWFGKMADAPPAQWQKPPTKIRPTRPKAIDNPQKIAFDQATLDSAVGQVQPPMDLWIVKQDDQEFGPIPFKTIINWATEGRITENSMVFRTDWGKWRSATKILPQLKSAVGFANADQAPQPEATTEKE